MGTVMQALHNSAIFRHIHSFKPAMLRPLQCVLNFLLQLGCHATLEGSLKRHDGLFAALLCFRHAKGGNSLPEVCLGVTWVEFSSEAGIKTGLVM